MKLGRVLGFSVTGILVLIVGAVACTVIFVDKIAKTGIEKGGTFAMGVNTTLDSASVGLLSGQFGLAGLDVANPAGFEKDPYFLKLGTGGMNVSLGSLTKDVVEVPKFELDNVNVTLIKGDKGSNYQIILDNLSRLKPKETKEKQPATEGKKFVIREIEIKNVAVKVDMLGVGGGLTAVNVPVDEIKLTNVGTGGDGAASIPEIAGVVIKAILASAVAHGGGVLPADLAGDLQSQLAKVEDLGGQGVQIISKAQGRVADVSKAAGDLSGKVKDAEKQAESTLGGLKDILGKPKKDDKK